MKINSRQPDHSRRLKGSRSGYTLVEVMLASGIFTMMFAALYTAQMIGMRLGGLVDSKSGASDASRYALQKLPTDIRSAKMWFIGNLSGTNFIAITNGPLQGPALELCQYSVGTQFTIYYFTNAGNNNGMLMRTYTSNWSPVVICSNLINTAYFPNGMTFTAENYAGQKQTNSITNVNTFKNIIHVTLQFCQFQYPLTVVGTNGLYDYYKLEFRATPHLPE
jgi:hypothetical protein